MKETKKINGIVINIYEKNDFDALIKVLSEEKFYYFISKGFFRKTGKNNQNIFIGSISEFEYFLKYGKENKFLLKRVSLLHFLDFQKRDFSLFLEKLFKLFQELEDADLLFFKTYEDFLKENDFYHKDFLITYLLNIVLKTKGKALNTNKCSFCGSTKNLYSIDFNEGGMLCFAHRTKKSITKLEYLKGFYYLEKSFETYKMNVSTESNAALMGFLKNFL